MEDRSRIPVVLGLVACIISSLACCSLAGNEANSGDLTVGREVVASSTCGLAGPQEFCLLLQSGMTGDCFVCDAQDPQDSHNSSALNDIDSSALGNRTWWQSENGDEEVSLQLNLEAEFYFTYLVLIFRSSRPAAAVVERSRNFGQTYEVYHYYSSDCMADFGLPDRSSRNSIDEVICTSEYSDLQPLSGGEFVYRAIPPSLGAVDPSNPLVASHIALTNLRIRFLHLNTFPGDNLTDPLTRRNYYYAVYSLVARGLCFCNGHAPTCDPAPSIATPLPGMVNSVCQCTDNTMGERCELCLPLFNDRPWVPGGGAGDNSSQCRECQCYGRASSCHYDPAVSMETGGSGGVCDGCTQNTMGDRCEECVPGYYRDTSVPLSDPQLCLPCDCDPAGSENGGICIRDDDPSDPSVVSGMCTCKSNVESGNCQWCLPGYFNLSAENPEGCQPCDCDPEGSVSTRCDAVTGQCDCVPGVMGRRCDTCPLGKIGPSRNTATLCTDCFCNGFTSECRSASGWYQATVANSFDTEEEGRSFRTNGVFTNQLGFLEAEPSPLSPNFLVVSLPQQYLGDKRTSFGQDLHLNLSLPNMASGDSCKASVEIIPRPTSTWPRRIKLVTQLASLDGDPQLIEVPLSPGSPVLNLLFTSRPASQREIRKILTDITSLRLVLEFPPGGAIASRTLRLYQTSLSFAVDSSSDEVADRPLEGVNYVEQCTCPRNRVGPNCGRCAAGYTTDPEFGGQFARCVRCFCNFHSDSCDPVTGACFNCSDNTVGDSCERCAQGFFRNSFLTFVGCMQCDCNPPGTVSNVCNIENGDCDCLEGYAGPRCDQCEDGLWGPGNGSCLPCNCHPNTSLSLICDKMTGQCDCREGVTGAQCDVCRDNTTGIFPSCEPCDECTGQWQRRIDPLREDVETTLELIDTVNGTAGELPALQPIFDLLDQIEAILSTSEIDILSQDIQSTHALLCELINQTQLLIQRALVVENQLDNIENISQSISSELSTLIASLVALESELRNISLFLDSIEVLDPLPYLILAEAARERSDAADEVITANVTSLIEDTETILLNFTTKLNESDVIVQQLENTEALSFLSQRLAVFQDLIREANRELCGAQSNDSCEECGGVSCMNCGGDGCDSLVNDAAEAVNISETALQIARGQLAAIQILVEDLQSLMREIETVSNSSTRTEEFANETNTRAGTLVQRIRELIQEIEVELNMTRIDPNEIGILENQTLSLMLPILPDAFFQLLLDINATIEAFFNASGVDYDDLHRRALEALSRAEVANSLASEVVSNATALEQQLQELERQADEVESTVSETERLVTASEEALDRTTPILDDAEAYLNQTREILANLTSQLAELQQQVLQNQLDLVVARNLTTQAGELATEVDGSSTVLEEDFNELNEEATAKYEQSVRDLEVALDLKNRTQNLQLRTQQRLLQVENLERIEQALLLEQEMIRLDIQRVANELRRLNEAIQIHITRNTNCLDQGTLSRR